MDIRSVASAVLFLWGTTLALAAPPTIQWTPLTRFASTRPVNTIEVWYQPAALEKKTLVITPPEKKPPSTKTTPTKPPAKPNPGTKRQVLLVTVKRQYQRDHQSTYQESAHKLSWSRYALICATKQAAFVTHTTVDPEGREEHQYERSLDVLPWVPAGGPELQALFKHLCKVRLTNALAPNPYFNPQPSEAEVATMVKNTLARNTKDEARGKGGLLPAKPFLTAEELSNKKPLPSVVDAPPEWIQYAQVQRQDPAKNGRLYYDKSSVSRQGDLVLLVERWEYDKPQPFVMSQHTYDITTERMVFDCTLGHYASLQLHYLDKHGQSIETTQTGTPGNLVWIGVAGSSLLTQLHAILCK